MFRDSPAEPRAKCQRQEHYAHLTYGLREVHTLPLQQFESRDNAQQLLAHVVPLRVCERVDHKVVVVAVLLGGLLRAAVDDTFQALEQVAEKVNVDEVGESSESLERGGKER